LDRHSSQRRATECSPLILTGPRYIKGSLCAKERSDMRKRPASRIKTLGDALDELVETLGIKKKLREQDVFVFWDKAVGERIAGVAKPTRILKGILFVSVKTGAWRNELSMRKQEIVGRLNEILADEIVKDIKFQ